MLGRPLGTHETCFRYHPEAEEEFFGAVDWYEDREPGLGRRFLNAVRSAVDVVVDDPEAWATWPGWDREPAVRSKVVNGFPYRLVYLVHSTELVVIAIAPQKREPGYWRARVVST